MSASVAELYELMTDLPPGAWVAISSQAPQVLAFGDDADLVMEQAKEKGEDHPFITRVPDPDAVMFF